MTHVIRSAQEGRIAARIVLAVFAAGAIAALVLPDVGAPDSALAQQSPSPTPEAPRIQFLNPSGATVNAEGSGPGREVSTKQDADQSYHLVAWTANAPSNAVVEFKWSDVDDDVTENTIGTGTRHGTDTWDIFWNSVPTTDGAYEVTVILFSGPGGREIARDEEEVVVNNQDAPRTSPGNVPQGEDRGETVEITYPSQAGAWGAFRQPGTSGPFIGVVDVDASDDSSDVRAYYTTSRPGDEPTWVRCSTANGETFADAANGVRCTLAEGVSPTGVTAIAAASGDANQTAPTTCAPATGSPVPDCGEGEDSGDAHRAFGYVQVPNAMTVTPSTQTQTDRDTTATGNQFECSSVINGVLTDQFGRKVAGANVDVHAAGPTDNLYFDDPDKTGTHQAPNSGNHSPEPSADCEDDTRPPDFNETSGQGQGEHEVAGEGDVKHIETAAAGTNDAGALPFRLVNRSTTIVGTTQISVFYDRDNDDRFCSEEVNGSASIGWGTTPASPTGTGAETTTCPEPQPTGTATSSPTPTPTPTPTRTATASPTPTPRAQCNDGVDNDGDGRTDFPADRGCTSSSDNSEASPAGAERCEEESTSSGRNVIIGTDSGETIQGTEGRDLICGAGGDDLIDALGGDDIVIAGDGADTVSGGDGDDDLEGGADRDAMRGEDGNDELFGGGGKDNLRGNDGRDRVNGDGQNDILSGGADVDVLLGNGGFDTIKGNADADIIDGQWGEDILQGGSGRDIVRGRAGNDLIKGGGGRDRLFGHGGADVLDGGPGRDRCAGGRGNNTIRRCE